MRKLLQSRWLYVVLVGVTGFVYFNAWRYEQQMAHTQELVKTDVVEQIIEHPLHWDAIRSEMARDPLLTLTVLSSGFLFFGMVVAGVFLTVRLLQSGKFSSLLRVPSKLPSRWTFGDLVRVIILVVVFSLWMPLLKLPVFIALPSWEQDMNLWLLVFMVIIDLFVIGIIITFGNFRKPEGWKAFGLPPANAAPAVRNGVRAYLTAFPWIFLILFSLAELAHRIGYEPPPIPIQNLIFEESRPQMLMLLALLVCVVGPIAEELLFRGVIFATLRQRMGLVVSMLLSGALFALMHGHWLGFFPIMLLGCVLSYIYDSTGTLLAPLLVHVLHNSMLLSKGMVMRQLLQL